MTKIPINELIRFFDDSTTTYRPVYHDEYSDISTYEMFELRTDGYFFDDDSIVTNTSGIMWLNFNNSNSNDKLIADFFVMLINRYNISLLIVFLED